jgi:hypothetical protein
MLLFGWGVGHPVGSRGWQFQDLFAGSPELFGAGQTKLISLGHID